MNKRIQRKRTKGWRIPENCIYIGRPTKWGNPYKLNEDGTREEVLQKYRNYLEVVLLYNPHFLDELKGKDICCWCPIFKNNKYYNCHGDIILEFLNKDNHRIDEYVVQN